LANENEKPAAGEEQAQEQKKPAEKTAGKPEEKHGEKPAEKAGEKRGEKPAEKAGEKPGEKPEEKKKKKRKLVAVHDGIAVISASFNNTLVTLTDQRGNVLAWSSSGKLQFRGAKKSTPFASQLVAEDAAAKAIERYNLQRVEVRVKGPGAGREAAIRALQASGLNVVSIRDVTPIPHNGCRPRKRRRV